MIYLLKSGKFLKIGFTSNIENRIKQYKTIIQTFLCYQ